VGRAWGGKEYQLIGILTDKGVAAIVGWGEILTTGVSWGELFVMEGIALVGMGLAVALGSGEAPGLAGRG